jgi:hypothetical protein
VDFVGFEVAEQRIGFVLGFSTQRFPLPMPLIVLWSPADTTVRVAIPCGKAATTHSQTPLSTGSGSPGETPRGDTPRGGTSHRIARGTAASPSAAKHARPTPRQVQKNVQTEEISVTTTAKLITSQPGDVDGNGSPNPCGAEQGFSTVSSVILSIFRSEELRQPAACRSGHEDCSRHSAYKCE